MPVSPDYAEGLAKSLLEVYTDAEEQLLGLIARRLTAGGDAPNWAEQQLLTVQDLRSQTRTLIGRLMVNADAELVDTILGAYNRGVALAGADLTAIGTPAALAFGGVDTGAVKALVDTTRSTLGAMVLPIQSAAEQVYRSVVAETAGRMLAGTVNRREASASSMLKWAARGITGFRDKAGRNWSMSSYAEMTARTAAAQAVVAGHVDRLVDNGHDLAQISDAPEECERCRPWEGKVVSLSGNTPPGSYTAPNGAKYTVSGTLAEARADGLFHPNCRHRTGIYVPGLTRPLVDTEDPEGNKLRVQQRAKERQIRELKRRAKVFEDTYGRNSGQAKAARNAVRGKAGEFKEWRTVNGRKDLAYRTSITPPKAHPPGPRLDRDPDLTPRPTPKPTGDPASFTAPRPGDLHPEEKIRNAEQVFGTGSDEHLAAVRRFRPKPPRNTKTPRTPPADVLDWNTRELRAAPDADLEDALARAYESDHANTDRLEAELDRREQAPILEAQARARRAEAAKAKREANQQAQWDEVARLIDDGEDPRVAVERVTGVTVEKQLKTEAFHRLDSEGTPGRTLEDKIRYRFRQELDRQYVDAEDETRGHMLSREAEAINFKFASTPSKQIDPRALFHGPEARARKWASPELKEWWDLNGRLTLDGYREQVITGTTTNSRRVDDFLT